MLFRSGVKAARATEERTKKAQEPRLISIEFECFGLPWVHCAGYVCAKRNDCSGSEENSLGGVAHRAKVCDNGTG